MSPGPEPLSGENPQAYIPGDRRRAVAAGAILDGRPTGTVLFADISGFTPLTEALSAELGPTRGVEELTATLDAVVSELLEVLHAYGGSAVYFSGDALTCWLGGDGVTDGARCALAMQERIRVVGVRRTPAGSEVVLSLKIALDIGHVRRFVVGDPALQRIDVLAGELMDAVAAAEHEAGPGDVVLAAGALAALGDQVRTTPRSGLPGARDEVRVLTAMATEEPAPERPTVWPVLPPEVVREWLLPAVWERMSAGEGEFLADLRPATPLFLRFGGFDFDGDPAAPARLDELVVAAQRIVHDRGGNVLQLTIGDKGASLYAVFGSPVAHEDDSAQACAAATELLDLERRLGVSDLQIGIARGRLRSGTYGHPQRRTFCCLGDAVNVAARLMMAAPPGTAYLTAAVERAAVGGVRTARLAPLTVKGKARPLEVARLLGPGDDRTRAAAGSRLPFVGRAEELRTLLTLADRAATGSTQVVVVAGEAGIGKSRLIGQLVDEIGDRFAVSRGRARPAGAALYTGWDEVLAGLLGLDLDRPPAALAAALPAAVAALDPALLPRVPLLGPLVRVVLPDNDLTAPLEPRLRKASLEATVVDLLAALAGQGPVAIVIDDAGRLDPLGRDLLDAVRRAAPARVLVVLGTRGGEPLTTGRAVSTLVLGELDPAAVEALTVAKVDALGGTRIGEATRRLVADRGDGNPFYVEELLSYLHERGVDVADDAAVAALDLPDSLQSLVLSRVDALSEHPRRVLKVASVIGRGFAPPVLTGTYPALGTESEAAASLELLTALALTLGPDDELLHHFRHAVTREVTYESLPSALRADLHGQVSRWLESRHAGDLDRVLDTLAFHFGRSTDEAKKREYLVRAGIAAQAAYANAAAEDYLTRALPLVTDSERVDLLLRVGQLRELQGRWAEAEDGYLEAKDLAGAAGDTGALGRCLVAAADVARKAGQFETAQGRLDEARVAFGDDDTGLARVLHLEGTVRSQQGHYPQARECYEASLRLRREEGDRAAEGALLSNLALVAECLGELDAAEDLNGHALQVRLDISDRPGVAVSHNNLGMLARLAGRADDALEHFTRSMALADEVGDRWLVAVGHHNLGNVQRDRPASTEAARREYREAYLFYADSDDRWSIALLLEDLAQLAAVVGGHADALALLGAADRLRSELDAPRPPALTEELSTALAPSREVLGGAGEATLAAGVAEDPEGVRRRVLRLCDPEAVPEDVGSMPPPQG